MSILANAALDISKHAGPAQKPPGITAYPIYISASVMHQLIICTNPGCSEELEAIRFPYDMMVVMHVGLIRNSSKKPQITVCVLSSVTERVCM